MTFSDEARLHLERYLDEMRASMDASESAEIEQDIRDHVEAELGERSAPVSAGELDAVLTRLGNPRQWGLPTDTAPPRPASSTEDWLGYANLALLLAGFALPFLLPVSWLMARWGLARLDQRGEDLGARRWILYPPLAVISIGILFLALLWPFGAFTELGAMAAQRAGAVGSDRFPPLVTVAVAFGSLGFYWILLGAAAAIGDRVVRFLFHPFAGGFRRRHGWRFSGAGAIVAVLGAVAAFLGAR